MNPRILLVTPDSYPGSLAACYYRAFSRRGLEAHLHLLFGGNRNNLLLRAISRFGLSRQALLRKEAETLGRVVEHFQPDLILFTNFNEEVLLKRFKEQNSALLFCLYSDGPLVAPGLHHSSFGLVTQHYDCIFTFARTHLPIFYLSGARRVEVLPLAHDPEIHHPVALSDGEYHYYESPVGYVGTYQLEFYEYWFKALVPFGLKIWGNQWNHLPLSSPLRGCWKGYAPSLAKVCGGSSIMFNFIRADHGCAHSMKTFEIPACRGFVITNRTDEQLEFFEEDECAVYFSTVEELIDKVKFYLERRALRLKILEAAWKRVQEYTYLHRIEKILEVYQELRD